jgi:hypothetical protein
MEGETALYVSGLSCFEISLNQRHVCVCLCPTVGAGVLATLGRVVSWQWIPLITNKAWSQDRSLC